jgi:hypothetical protein
MSAEWRLNDIQNRTVREGGIRVDRAVPVGLQST